MYSMFSYVGDISEYLCALNVTTVHLGSLFNYLQVSVRMETSDWWVGLLHLKDVWRFAGMMSGEQCVMISGQALMELWLVGNWDFLQQVLYLATSKYSIICFAESISTFFVQVQLSSIVQPLARALVPSS